MLLAQAAAAHQTVPRMPLLKAAEHALLPSSCSSFASLSSSAHRWSDVQARRTQVDEQALLRVLGQMTGALRAGWSQPKSMLWLGRDIKEQQAGAPVLMT